MKIGKKELSFYWKIIKLPVYVLIGWSVLAFIVALASFSLYTSIFSSFASWILTIVVFGFIGWTTVKDHKEQVGTAAWAGAIAGVISGVVGAVIGIVMFYLVPDMIEIALQQAAQAGANTDALIGIMKIWVFAGLIMGPIFNAIIGSIISLIAGFIAKKV